MIVLALFLTGCNIGRGFQPPPEGYEGFEKPRVSNEEIMQDCGFPDVNHTSKYHNTDINAFTKSTICMEKKGYRSNRHGGICNIDSFKNTEACQKLLRNGASND